MKVPCAGHSQTPLLAGFRLADEYFGLRLSPSSSRTLGQSLATSRSPEVTKCAGISRVRKAVSRQLVGGPSQAGIAAPLYAHSLVLRRSPPVPGFSMWGKARTCRLWSYQVAAGLRPLAGTSWHFSRLLGPKPTGRDRANAQFRWSVPPTPASAGTVPPESKLLVLERPGAFLLFLVYNYWSLDSSLSIVSNFHDCAFVVGDSVESMVFGADSHVLEH